MKRYFRVYKKLLNLNLQSLTAYRMNFINSIISTVVWGSISFVAIFLLTARTTTVLGWSREEMLLLVAVYNIVTGLFHVFFSRNFERFSRIIHFAEFDGLLVKPLDPQFSISVWYFGYTSIFRVMLGVIILLLLLRSDLITVLYLTPFFLFLTALGIALMYSTWFLVCTFIIRNSNLSNLVWFLYEINGFARYPNDIYKQLGTLGFSFFIPLTIMITIPTKLFTHTLTFSDFALLAIVTASFLLLTRVAWMFTLRYYTSASG